jgi:type III secretion protein R
MKGQAALTGALDQPLSLVIALGVLGLLPFALMSLTSFVKTSTVLHSARSALGAQNIPSSAVIMALSAALSCVAMAPLTSEVVARLEPVLAQSSLSSAELVKAGYEATSEPLRNFLVANASPRELDRFQALALRTQRQSAAQNAAALANAVAPNPVTHRDFSVAIPAFIVSELTAAFTLGFAIYLPFLVLDLVVANVLMALGMQMMNPTQVSLPFKLLLFVASNGWGLLCQTLATGYRMG